MKFHTRYGEVDSNDFIIEQEPTLIQFLPGVIIDGVDWTYLAHYYVPLTMYKCLKE